ncbi:MAG: SMUG2 DNA glycosylase family protein [Bacteroidales bacterium]
MFTFAQKVIRFNRELFYDGKLPEGIRVMNPFRDREVRSVSERFYRKFYNDHKKRRFILGINPGRFGAGTTGVAFTDTKRLEEVCGIPMDSANTHEPSSVFIYDLIARYGGPERFYGDYYINSISPLGFVRLNNRGNWVNCNYYDYESLYQILEDFILSTLKQQVDFGIDRRRCFVLGKKNARYFDRINRKENLFSSYKVLDHPRYIVQYKARYKEDYIKDYLNKLTQL